MPAQDTSMIKEKILFILRKRGPSLPIHISSETGLSPLFASAFLAELLSERKIKISHMKVGNSPLYLIAGQEPALERFSQHLKSKEREAFDLLREKRFLKDTDQEPAIRVALRSIRDFAMPFKKNEEIFWRYFIVPEAELKIREKPKKVEVKRAGIKKPWGLDIFDREIKEKPKRKIKRRTPQKKDDKFFNKVKEFLSKKEIEITDIENFSKNELVLRVKVLGEEKLVIAYNKKRINENDVVRANKRASESKLPYLILSLGRPLKRLDSIMDALKNMSSIETLK